MWPMPRRVIEAKSQIDQGVSLVGLKFEKIRTVTCFCGLSN